MPIALDEPLLRSEVSNQRLDHLRKVLNSVSFSKAPRLCSFLEYIVERSIHAKPEDLTEQQIGIHVFGRTPGYNSGDDNIVRGTARHLRQRLAMYYQDEGVGDPLRIEIPKGGYVAHFEEVALPSPPAPTPPLSPAVPLDASPSAATKASPSRFLPMAALLVFACGLTALATWWIGRPHPAASARIGSAPLWNTLFTPGRNTILVPGDAGLNMFEMLEDRRVDLSSYTHGSYLDAGNASSPAINAAAFGRHSYTTMSDLQLVSRLVRLPPANTDRTIVRFARDLNAQDLRDANLILLGSASYNPWVDLYQSQLDLQLVWDVDSNVFVVSNRSPRPGEQSQYSWSPKNGTQGGLTLIALTDNPNGGGRVLLIEGTTMLSVYGASDFLFDKQLLDPVLAKAARHDGSVGNFEVLLRSDFIREGVSNLHIVAEHVQ